MGRIDRDRSLIPTPLADVGDHFASDVVGVLDYSFGNFKLNVTAPVAAVDARLLREITAAPGVKENAIATFNVENLARPTLRRSSPRSRGRSSTTSGRRT